MIGLIGCIDSLVVQFTSSTIQFYDFERFWKSHCDFEHVFTFLDSSPSIKSPVVNLEGDTTTQTHMLYNRNIHKLYLLQQSARSTSQMEQTHEKYDFNEFWEASQSSFKSNTVHGNSLEFTWIQKNW